MSEVPFELQLLRRSVRYQQWAIETVQPFLGERILEVGAGIGNMSKWLPLREKLVVSEANSQLVPELKATLSQSFHDDPRVRIDVVDLGADWVEGYQKEDFDTVISFNVLEHVEDDHKAIGDLVRILRKSRSTNPKRLVSFVPAHQWAFGSLDQEFQHFRRYSPKNFRTLAASLGTTLHFQHFNIVGLPGWYWMGKILKKRQIGMGAVDTFEKICPLVKGADNWLHQKLRVPLGQSLIAVMTL